MGHSIDDVYRLVNVMYEKAVQLHRVRYSSEAGEKYDEQHVTFMVEDLQALARQLANDSNIDHKLSRWQDPNKEDQINGDGGAS